MSLSTGVIRKIITFSWGTWIGLIVSIISLPVLTRLFAPSEFGLAGIIVMSASLITQLCSLGMVSVFVRHYFEVEISKRNYLLWKCLKYPLLMVLIIAVISILFYLPITTFLFGNPSLPLWLLTLLLALITLLNNFSDYVLRVSGYSHLYSICQLISKLFGFLFAVIFFYIFKNHTASGIVLANLGAVMIVTFFSMSKSKHIWIPNLQSFLVGDNDKAYIKYGLPYLFAALIYYFNSNIDRLVLNHYVGLYEVGIYTAIFRLSLVLIVVRTGFDAYFMPELMRKISQNDSDNLNKYLIQVNKVYSFILFIIFILLFAVHDVFRWFFGVKYSIVVYICMFILLDPVLNALNSSYTACMEIAKRSKYLMYIAILTACINLAFNLVLVPKFGLRGTALATGITAVIYVLLTMVFARMAYKVNFSYFRVIFMVMLFFTGCCLSLVYSSFIISVFMALLMMSVLFILYKDIAYMMLVFVKNNVLNKKVYQ